MEYKYIWNSKSNCFDGYEPRYEEHANENGNVERIEIPCDKTLYTQEQVDAIFKNRGTNQVIKDVNGIPTAVDLYTESELAIADKKKRIAELKSLLQATDYQAIKYTEGFISEEDYLPIKQTRQEYRNEINELETQIIEEQAN